MKETLIILPGWSGTEAVWNYQCDHLKDVCTAEVKVITNQNTAELMAKAVLANAPKQFHLIGHSLGGLVAQHIAILEPDRIKTLILIGTGNGDVSHQSHQKLTFMLKRIEEGRVEQIFEENLSMLLHPSRKNDVELIQLIKDSQTGFPKEGLINQTKALLSTKKMADLLPNIICPTLIIYGRQDKFYSLDIQYLMRDRIPKAKLTIIEDCGHMPQVERPQAVSALIRLWLQS